MKLIKKTLEYGALYLVCLSAISTIVYLCYVFYPQKTLHLDKKQWHPAEPETQNIDNFRLTKALDYVNTRLPTARSLLMLRNGKTVVEKYYWLGGPKETDYLHSLNLPLLQVLIGIAIDQQLIQGPEQSLSAFFPKHLKQTQSDGAALLTLSHLLKAQASVLWGAGDPDYWKLFYAGDRIEASLRVISRQQIRIQPTVNFAAAYLLSQVIEQVSGQSVFDFAYLYLFQPLGITTYAPDADDLPRDPMVGFQLKTLDLAKIGYLLTQEGTWEGQRIVSKEWVRWLFFKVPYSEFDDSPGGSWAKTTIRGHESLMVRGDGGQYLVLVPALHVVVVTTSTSRFALPQDNGHGRLLQLIIEAVLETSGTEGMVVKPKLKSESESGQYTDIIAPNYVFSIPVPQDILDFFYQFAQDIDSNDRHRIARNYARGYDHRRDIFSSPSRLMLDASPPHLQYVHITKLRIENNRAYLRGTLKFDYINLFAGLDGVWPLENLIKLKGRWRWLGLPEKTAILDRDDYFDAELSEEQQRFVDDCSGPLVGESTLFGNDCFAETFQLAGGGKELFAERLQPFLQGRSGVDLHITGVQRNGTAYRVQGYIEGSALGELRLPDDLHIVKENGVWKWQGIIDSKQTE
ncbi:MAG: serine hydrolase [Desulfobacterales bacterium]|jgi:CubicO group peptidase (beta-lactamase class C family)